MKQRSRPRLLPLRRPDTGVGEWLAAMVRGLDALEFLERSRELAAETVVPSEGEGRAGGRSGPTVLAPSAGHGRVACDARSGRDGGAPRP